MRMMPKMIASGALRNLPDTLVHLPSVLSHPSRLILALGLGKFSFPLTMALLYSNYTPQHPAR